MASVILNITMAVITVLMVCQVCLSPALAKRPCAWAGGALTAHRDRVIVKSMPFLIVYMIPKSRKYANGKTS